jgi:hypothetical protein
MADEKTAIQRAENTSLEESGGKSILARVGESEKAKGILYFISGGAAVTTVLTHAANWFTSLYPFLATIGNIGAVVFVFAALAYYFLSLRPREKALLTTVQKLNAKHQTQLESLNLEYESAVEAAKLNGREVAEVVLNRKDEEITELKRVYDRHRSLIELAGRQREFIENYVDLEAFVFSRIHGDANPVAIFLLRVRNRSMFEIELSNNVGGQLWYETEELRGVKRFDPQTPRVIGASDVQVMTFEVQITKEEREHIEKTPEKYRVSANSPLFLTTAQFFEVDKLQFTINAAGDGTEIEPKLLKFRGYGGKGFKVISYEQYDNAIRSFI